MVRPEVCTHVLLCVKGKYRLDTARDKGGKGIPEKSERKVHSWFKNVAWSTRTSSSGGGDPTSEGRGGGRGGRQSPSLGQRSAPTQGPAGAYPHVGAGRGQAVSGVAHLGAGLAHGPALAIRAGGALVQGLHQVDQVDKRKRRSPVQDKGGWRLSHDDCWWACSVAVERPNMERPNEDAFSMCTLQNRGAHRSIT
jgi:hypothetical protein